MTSPHGGLRRRSAWVNAGALGLLALLINRIDIQLLTAETPNFVFGGSLVLVAFVLFGTGPGLLAAVLSLAGNFARLDVVGLITVIYVVEAWTVYALGRRTGSLLAASAIFWLVAGIPLDWLLYHRLGDLTVGYVSLLYIKQILNGLFNALIATGMLRVPAVSRRRAATCGREPQTVRRFVFDNVALAVVPPLLVLAVLFTRSAYESRIAEISGTTRQTARGAALAVQEFNEVHEHAIELTARRLDAAVMSGADPAEVLRAHHAENPDYLNLTVTDATGTITLSDPEATPDGTVMRGRNVAHRAYFRDASRTLGTTFSPVILGRLNMRTPSGEEPIMIVAEPLLDGTGDFRGILFAAIDVRALQPLIQRHRASAAQVITVFDAGHNVVVATDGLRMPGDSLGGIVPRDSLEGAARSFVFSPPAHASRESALGLDLRYASMQPLHEGGMGVLAETPAHVVHAGMLPAARHVLGFIVTTFLLLAAIVIVVGRAIAAPLLEADRLATAITEGDDRTTDAVRRLAESPVAEARSLADRLATMRDALAEKAARSEAREQESADRFEAFSHATHDVVWEWDPRTDTVWWNAAMQSRFGYGESDVRGTLAWWEARIHEGDRQRVLDAIHAVRTRPGAEFTVEYRFRRADDTFAIVLDHGRVLADADGAPARIVGAITDVTSLRHAETERARLEKRLQRIQKMEAVGLLAGGVAHDFNNLLTPILGYADIAADYLPEDHPGRADLAEIRSAATLAQDLTRQLLAFGRRQVLALSVFDVNEAILRFHGMLRRMVREDVRIDLDLDARTCPIRADRGQIEQALMNLAANAQDAMPNGGTLTIATRVVTTARPQAGATRTSVLLTVSDSGHGMDRDTVNHIFEPFFTTKERGKGTGLGLATVHGIVEQHGGAIDVESERRSGTRFRITLPCAAESATVPVTEPVELPATSGEGTTILLAEDEAAVRGLVRRVLTSRGYTVLEAATPDEALHVAQSSGHIDLLISDVIMPGMNGADLARRLTSARPELRVVFMSGYPDTAITRHGVLEPGVNFLAKPFAAGDLLARVADVLARDGAAVA